jgi:hypothetical protein
LATSTRSTKENDVNRKDRFIWKDDDIEVLRTTARAIAYDDARNRLREVEVIDADPRQAADRATVGRRRAGGLSRSR